MKVRERLLGQLEKLGMLESAKLICYGRELSEDDFLDHFLGASEREAHQEARTDLMVQLFVKGCHPRTIAQLFELKQVVVVDALRSRNFYVPPKV